MAIESAVMLRKVARIAFLILLAGFMLSDAATGQLPIKFQPGNPPPVTVGSVIPFSHGSTGTWSQVYSMKIDPAHGNVLFLDSALSELFQLAPNASSPVLIAGPAPQTGNSDCSDLEKSGSYWNAAIAFDKFDNLYVTDRYGSAVQFCRVPYNSSAGTWSFTTAAKWQGPTYKNSSGNQVAIPPQDLQVGDDGVTFYVSTSSTESIYKYTVDSSGAVSNVTALATGLEDMVSNLAVDHAGNVFFLENAYDSPSSKVAGIREIPAGSPAIVGAGDGKAESALARVDQGGFNGIKGMSFDAQGNLYFTSENNTSYGGTVDGVFMIPNEGTPGAPNLVWADTIEVSPVSSGFPPLVDPRGLLWLATGGSGNWTPPGTNGPTCDSSTTQTAAATCLASSVVLWQPGAANLASVAVGGVVPVKITAYSATSGGTLTLTANNEFVENEVVTISAPTGDALAALNGQAFYVGGTGLSGTQFQISTSAITGGGSTSATATADQAQTLFFMFNAPATVASFALAKPSGSNFLRVTTNPMANPTATAPVPICTDGGSYPAFSATETTTSTYSYCTYYAQLNSAVTGNVEGEVQLLDSNGNVFEGSNAYLNGVGEGAAITAVSSATIQPIATGLNTPRQVSSDPAGNTYVADSALKAIEMYPAGTTSPTAGKVIGTGLSAPTGVAIDGVGNLYVGDSGKVIMIPYINGALATTQQTTLATGFGTGNLGLAVDGAGDVFVADQQKKQVVEIPNPQAALMLAGLPLPVLGATAGFKSPSAVSVDSAGNVWVADGSNLWEIEMPFGGANEVIANGLQAPVTGLAVDPSGSVFAAGASGIVWIPFNAATGSLNINGQVVVATGLGSTPALPTGLALDGSQNLYATFVSGTAAGLAQLGISGTINFNDYGELNPNVPFEVDAQLLNVGNLDLTLADLSTDTPGGANPADYTVGPATEEAPACGPTTNTPPGGSCYLGLVLQAPAAGATSASVAVLSNAANAKSGLNLSLSGNVVQDFRPGTQITIAPIPNVVYPGSVSVQVTVAATDPTYGTPTGTVSLSVSGESKQTQTLDASGSATFNYKNLEGGSYNVTANFNGDGTAGSTQNTCTPAGTTCFAGSASKTKFTVTQAQPTFVVGPPVTNSSCLDWTTGADGNPSSNCQPNPKFVTSWAGNTYVQTANPVWITASVTSKVGTPTGSVTFMQNGKPVDPTQGVGGAIALNGNGIASFSLQNLPTGVYDLTAAYSGDVNYSMQNVTVGEFHVIIPSVQVTQTNSGAVSVTPGTPVQVSLTLMPLVGFSGDVSLECDSSDAPVAIPATNPSTALPPFSQCTFAYGNTVSGTSSVGSGGPTATTIVVTISTNVPTNGGSTSAVTRAAPWSLAGLFGIGLLGLAAGRKRLNRYLALICLAAMMSGAFMGITACTNAGYSTPPPAPKVTTPKGNYNVQIITYDPHGLKQNSLTNPAFTLPVNVQ
ncbi:MAG TPA: Ig-like domain repeat protein [Terracidiphilus sp.]|nr:Ig-like domain repeat protein [Terracidiphilus sp.]